MEKYFFYMYLIFFTTSKKTLRNIDKKNDGCVEDPRGQG